MKTTTKILGIIALTALIIFAFASCDEASTSLVGKWYLASNHVGGVAYEFTADGKVLVLGLDQGVTYTTSGNTITISIYGFKVGTIDYKISGTQLILSNSTGTPGIVAGTYYK